MAVRLRIREVADAYGINRYELGRRAHLSNPTMDELWLRPERANPRLQTLERLALALTTLIHEHTEQQAILLTVIDLLELVPD